uniref:Uncharacterized protein n=1 Tax=Cacopsylla melanoneura TaxID=428564 RepID=A0A8D8TDS1_9HEMI
MLLNFNGLIVPEFEERKIDDRKGETQPFRVQNFYFEKILPRPGIEPATPGSRGKCLYHLPRLVKTVFWAMKFKKSVLVCESEWTLAFCLFVIFWGVCSCFCALL